MSETGACIDAEPSSSDEICLGGYLAKLSLPRQVLSLALWPLLEQVLAFFVGMTDLLISGRMAVGVERVAILDAMGLGGYVGWFFSILQGAVATGVLALVSRATGAGEKTLANRSLGQGLWLGIGAGTISILILLAGMRLLIQWIGLSPEAALQAEKFLRVLAWSGPFSGALFAVNAALRGSGDTRTPFLSMIVVNVVNMAMSWTFVFGPGALGGHGVGGIACGTVIGWACGLLTVILLLGRGKKETLQWSRADLEWDPVTIRRILRVGAPQTLEITAMWMIHMFGIKIIAGLKEAGSLGAHILAIRVESMSYLPGFAIATAAATLAGQYLGAGSKKMAEKAVSLSWKSAVILMGAMGVFFVFEREMLIGWMAPDSPLHLRLASPLLLACALAQPFYATCIVLKTSMRGAGATRIVMRWSFGSMIFYRVIVLWVMSHLGIATLTWVWIIFSMDHLTQAVIFIRLYFQRKWLDAVV